MTFTKKKLRVIILCVVATIIISLSGCSSYTVPSKGAPMKTLVSASITHIPTDYQEDTIDIDIADRHPLAEFPADIVYIRVQETGYRSYTNVGYGSGNYSVITIMDIEDERDFERLASLRDIAQLSRIPKLLLPSHYNSDQELRQASSRLNADMLLIYTVDTTFFNVNQSAALTVISVGLFPTNDVHIISTVSAILMDAKTGYIYGTIDKPVKEMITTSVLSTKEKVDKKRLSIEREAFDKFLDEFEKLWPSVVAEYNN